MRSHGELYMGCCVSKVFGLALGGKEASGFAVEYDWVCCMNGTIRFAW